MTLIFRRLSKTSSCRRYPPPLTHQLRPSSFDATAVKFVRDRGLDHAVERERNLRPLINLKNLLKSEPSKSLPISVISQNRDSLRIPIRPIEFVRRYPSVFEEFMPGGVAVHPHFKLKDEVLELDADEQLIYQSESYRKDAADRVLKLLMISRVNKVPLGLLDQLMWDMGLPRDFVQSIVSDFPDYFRVAGNGDFGSESCRSDKVGVLELVCWSNEHAVSAIEKKGTPVVFPMNFSKGFEIDKKFKKWVDEWQRLPYVSPYEDGSHLGPQTGESDKWAAAVLHELLNLFVSKKTEKDNVLSVGEFLGIRSRFKMALLNHPGIFYLSKKLGTYTVVLKGAFKRGSLIEEHPIMVMRSRYIHLMHTIKEEQKVVTAPSSSSKKQDQKVSGLKEHAEDKDESEEDNGVRQGRTCRNASARRGKTSWERDSNSRNRPTSRAESRMDRRQYGESDKNVSTRSSGTGRQEARRDKTSWERDSNSRNRPTGRAERRMDRRQFGESDNNISTRSSGTGRQEARRGKASWERDSSSRNHPTSRAERRMDRRQFGESDKNVSTRSSGTWRQEARRGDKPRTRSQERSNVSTTRSRRSRGLSPA
ncbi:hypothetical protein CDL15_Pgr028348 [Punica granatum]|uniref:PORR domain-containing protein n=1 Tax=Punica granatum TaxID=22663 RepID=A0A218W3Z3_PUNGR|nr:hypothetical protein CDL15_Pgr028348 [Punica granatum]